MLSSANGSGSAPRFLAFLACPSLWARVPRGAQAHGGCKCRLLPRGFELLGSWGCAGAVISRVVSASGSAEQLPKHRRSRACPGWAPRLGVRRGGQPADRGGQPTRVLERTGRGGILRCREGLAPR